MLPSPCTGICRIDAASDLCTGCARSRGEIAAWGSASQEFRDRVWQDLPRRRAALGIGLHRLPWGADEVRAFLVETLREGGGAWVSGPFGAVAEFCVGPGEAVDLEVGEDRVTARTARGAIEFRNLSHVRAFVFTAADRPAGRDVVVLAVARQRAPVSDARGLTSLGPDGEALDPAAHGDRLYHFGLGRRAGEFGFRTAAPDLIANLDRRLGAPWPEVLADLGGCIVQASPTRVVRNAIGRIEVYAPIPATGDHSPEGPHTHFLPDSVALGVDAAPGLELADAYVPCAVHYRQSPA